MRASPSAREAVVHALIVAPNIFSRCCVMKRMGASGFLLLRCFVCMFVGDNVCCCASALFTASTARRT